MPAVHRNPVTQQALSAVSGGFLLEENAISPLLRINVNAKSPGGKPVRASVRSGLPDLV